MANGHCYEPTDGKKAIIIPYQNRGKEIIPVYHDRTSNNANATKEDRMMMMKIA